MGKFKPSKYQQAIFTYIAKGKGNAVVDAVAGSGKTTTMVQVLNVIPYSKKVFFGAFNKSIAKELERKAVYDDRDENVRSGKAGKRMENVMVSTIHSLACKTILRALGAHIDSDKYTVYLNERIEDKRISPTVELAPDMQREWKQNIRKLIGLVRTNLARDYKSIKDLCEKHEIFCVDNEIAIVLQALDWGKRNIKTIDFDDMIWLPNVLSGLHRYFAAWKFDYMICDECQDLNAAQRGTFMQCLAPGGRFIAVGDERQAIYGFAGADADSFQKLLHMPHTAKLPLSINYRCDKSILRLAQQIVPQIQWRPDAEEGTIDNNAKLSDVRDGDMVLCRVSAPLVSACMAFLAKGRKAYIKGADIGKNLANMIRNTKAKNISTAIEKLEKDNEKLLSKIMGQKHCTVEEGKQTDTYRAHADKVDAIKFLGNGSRTCQEVIDRINKIFKDDTQEGITLSTIHKAKGLENDRVFIIRPDKLLLPFCMRIDWMATQEYNLKYVAITRAKHYLGVVPQENMSLDDDKN